MAWKKFDNDSDFYRFMGQAGAMIPARLLPQSARDALVRQEAPAPQPEQDPDEQAHEQRKEHK